MDRLDRYRAKRSADRTPEPFGSKTTGTGQTFVVQMHAARRVHYDLRLEMDGVLVSWAVPKGPSANPADKRLAVATEDHPLEYADFEGMIPEGNYGAGAVIVWDRGTWVPIEDPAAGLERGKLLFELRGYKLRGTWTLVKIKKSENEWLLIKERDGLASERGTEDYPADSILSGLTVEQLRDGHDRAAPIRRRLEELNAPKQSVSPDELDVMLAESRETAFSDADWVFELKYDGYRMLAGLDQGTPRLLSRAGNDLTGTFPEIAAAIGCLPFRDLVLDGEVVVHDDSGLPSFGRLQKRGRLSRPLDIKRAAAELPATLYVFDLLTFEGYDARSLPLVRRKNLLQEVVPTVGPIRYSDHIAEQGEAMFREVQKMKLEGIIAKRAAGAYRGGRSGDWLKIRTDRSDDFLIVGFTEPKGSRGGFGALHVAQYADGELVYEGRVGTGFDTKQLEEIRQELEARLRDTPPCSGPVPDGAEHRWVEPDLVAEIKFREITEAGLLRHPVFVRLRDDKMPAECLRLDAATLEEPVPVEQGVEDRSFQFTNLDKVFWPQEGYTKGDLIEFYRVISDWLLPYLVDRPLVMTRFPDGIEGKSFFQKDAPGFAPEWIRRETLWSEGSQRQLDYFVCDSREALLYVANLASIPLHIWSSRVGKLEHPDWSIIDLDPKEAPFEYVIRAAHAIKDLCDEIDLPSFVKTSGSSGLHVLVPLGGNCTYEQSRSLAQLIARVVELEMPEVATTARALTKREGRVYLDFVQNGHGRLLVSPFCVRPLPGAPVSTPLDWEEVTDDLDIRNFTIESVPDRMKSRGSDPMAPVLTLKPDLTGALQRLLERFE